MIEIKTNPHENIWEIRIVGGSSFIGSILWQPQDDIRFSRDFTPRLNSARQINRAEGFGGPYAVKEHGACEAKLFDWKGKLRTVGPGGAPLPNPRRDVITFDGNPGRHLHRAGGRSPVEFVFKDGEKYARMPTIDNNGRIDFDGFAAPVDEGRLGLNSNVIGGFAIQEDPTTGELRDVLIMNTIRIGGSQGIREWRVFWRPAGRGMASNGVFRFAQTPQDDDNKWRPMGVFALPSDTSSSRLGRKDSWFFNESGTEAVIMLPVNEVGDYAGAPSFVPIPQYGGVSASAARNETTVGLDVFPFYYREVTFSIDAFANTNGVGEDLGEVTLDVGGRLGAPITGNATTNGSESFGGQITERCDTGARSGSLQESGSSTREVTVGGETSWQVAVDYRGDSKVRLFMTLEAGGTSENFSYNITTPANDNATGSVSQGKTQSATFRLTGAGINLVIGGYEFTDGTTITGLGAGPTTGSKTRTFSSKGGPVTNFIGSDGLPSPRGSLHILWLDLREGLIAYNYVNEVSWDSKIGISQWFSGGGGGGQPGPLPAVPSHFFSVSSTQGTSTGFNGFRLVKNGSVIVERRFEVPMSVPFSMFSFGGVAPLGLKLESFGGCAQQDPGSTRVLSYASGVDPPTSSSLVSTPIGPFSIDSINGVPNQFNVLTAIGIQGLGVDTSGNLATTWNLSGWIDGFLGVSLFAAGSSAFWRPFRDVDPADRYINLLTGLTEDELLALVNSIQHTEPGPDGLWDGVNDTDIIGLQADEQWRLFIIGIM